MDNSGNVHQKTNQPKCGIYTNIYDHFENNEKHLMFYNMDTKKQNTLVKRKHLLRLKQNYHKYSKVDIFRAFLLVNSYLVIYIS